MAASMTWHTANPFNVQNTANDMHIIPLDLSMRVHYTANVRKKTGEEVRLKMQNEERELLKIPRVAFIADVSVATVRRWIARGDLPAVKIGGSIRVRRADLERYINESAEVRIAA